MVDTPNILGSIGNTPLVGIKNLNNKKKVRILAKLEKANPRGSVKDRPAYWMIKRAIESGERYLSTTLFRSICAKCPL